MTSVALTCCTRSPSPETAQNQVRVCSQTKRQKGKLERQKAKGKRQKAKGKKQKVKGSTQKVPGKK